MEPAVQREQTADGVVVVQLGDARRRDTQVNQQLSNLERAQLLGLRILWCFQPWRQPLLKFIFLHRLE
eukprot:1287104-Prymnesium_polylepis.1